RHGAMVCAAAAPDVLSIAAPEVPGVRPAASAAWICAAGHGGGRPLRARPLPADAGCWPLLDGRELRADPENRARRLRVLVGAVLLRHGKRTGCDPRLQPGR